MARADALFAEFPARTAAPMLLHNDLHGGNVLLDARTKRVRAVIDWEHASLRAPIDALVDTLGFLPQVKRFNALLFGASLGLVDEATLRQFEIRAPRNAKAEENAAHDNAAQFLCLYKKAEHMEQFVDALHRLTFYQISWCFRDVESARKSSEAQAKKFLLMVAFDSMFGIIESGSALNLIDDECETVELNAAKDKMDLLLEAYDGAS